MLIDPEIEAMHKSHEFLKDLDESSKRRVIQWLISKFGLADELLNSSEELVGNKKVGKPKLINRESNIIEDINDFEFTEQIDEISIDTFDTVADFFSKINPGSGSEKALTIATYLQIKNNKQALMGHEINKELKHLGHGATNITSDISNLINKKPQYMIQTRKEGKTQQAKKKYKVTNEGIKHIKSLINSES